MRQDKKVKRAISRKAHKAQQALLRLLKEKDLYSELVGNSKASVIRMLVIGGLVEPMVGSDKNDFLIDAAARLCSPKHFKKKTHRRKIYSPVKITKFSKEQGEIEANFLDSWDWKKLRYEVLKEFGRRCMCCGATPETGAVICVDHIKPRHTHPELKLVRANLQVLCYDCNKGKGAWDETDFR